MIFVLIYMLVPQTGHEYDTYCWKEWAKYIYEGGLSKIYYSFTDYLPLYHYTLKLYGLMQDGIESIESNIYQLKLINLLFHFVTGFFLALVVKKDHSWEKVLFFTMFYLLNIAILYNTIIWGQVDEVLTCYIFISCYFAHKKKVLSSLIFFVIAINFKLQAIIFIPVIGLMLLPVIISSYSAKKMITWLLVPLLIQALIIMPFILSGTVDKMWNVIIGSFGKYPVVSMNAYNIWDFLLSGDLFNMPDSETFKSVTYKNWGLLMFFATSGVALFPLAKHTFLSIKNKTAFNFPLPQLLIICAIIPLLFFYLNTQMHERYSHPALVFLIAYSIFANKPFISIIGCLAYFLNLESVFRFMDLNNYGTLIFNRDFISALYLITIVWLYVELFDFKFKKRKSTHIQEREVFAH